MTWEKRRPILLFLLALVINGVALALSHNFLDGDAHTRTYMAMQWLKDPFFITRPNDVTWVFGPVHCYLNALALLIWNVPPLTPRLLSLLLTSLTIFPIYYSAKLVFGAREAFYTTLLFCFYTLFIHPAAIAAGEGINLLFIFLGIWLFLRYRHGGRWYDLILSGISLMLASGMRYESWVIAALLAIVLLWSRRATSASGDGRSYLKQILAAVVFGLVSYSFAIMWIIACWKQWGDPLYFMHYSGNLDAPLIAERIRESGALKFMAYNLAFLPAVMLISFPVTTLAVAVVGFFHTLRRNLGNIFVLLFVLYVVLHLVLFVFSLQRFPLARFTTLPGAFLLMFAGTGVVFLKNRLKPAAGKALVAVLIVVAAANVVGLSFFSHPSSNDIEEKLRAVSPVTSPPEYFCQAISYCDSLLAAGNDLVVDCRNYNDRLLYLSLYRHYNHVYQNWHDNNGLASFIEDKHPEFVLYTNYPRNNHELFDFTATPNQVVVAGVPYKQEAQFGIFTILMRKQL